MTAEVATDKVVWPLLDAGKTVRAIEAETNISRSVVARSRQRWDKARGTAAAGTTNLSQDDDAGNGTTTAGTTALSQDDDAGNGTATAGTTDLSQEQAG